MDLITTKNFWGTLPPWKAVNIMVLFGHRGSQLKYVDVLCYRDYTREGKRVNTHSLVIKKVKIPNYVNKTGIKWKFGPSLF